MPWQFGALDLTESGGNRLIKYADALINGVGPCFKVLIQTTAYDLLCYRHRRMTVSPDPTDILT